MRSKRYRMLWRSGILVLFYFLASVPLSHAQNVTGYGLMSDPLLFLLREPAVHEDLALNTSQAQRLAELNESFDGILLSTRNMPPEKAQEQTLRVMQQTGDELGKILTQQQLVRIGQIAYQLRGMAFVLRPHAAEQLKLTPQQKAEIEAIVKETLETIGKAQSSTYEGPDAHAKSQEAIVTAREQEQQRILATLDDVQKQQAGALLGKRFDARSLGRVMFKAPEFSEGDEWINSEALRVTDLRGQVIALHFWTFG